MWQPQPTVLVVSTHATCFDRTDRPQALNTVRRFLIVLKMNVRSTETYLTVNKLRHHYKDQRCNVA